MLIDQVDLFLMSTFLPFQTRQVRRPGPCVQAVGGGLVGQQLWYSDESALEAA